MTRSATLCHTGQAVLEAAATCDDHLAFPPEHLPAAAKRAVAALVVLAAWDSSTENRPDLPGTIEALRAVLTSKVAPRKRSLTGAPHQPRADTKRAAVLTLLRRPEGATVAPVADATGWATHTVRGFFAGLKKAGIPVDVLERVRQVGPGKEGAKGSYSVYRVAEEARCAPSRAHPATR